MNVALVWGMTIPTLGGKLDDCERMETLRRFYPDFNQNDRRRPRFAPLIGFEGNKQKFGVLPSFSLVTSRKSPIIAYCEASSSADPWFKPPTNEYLGDFPSCNVNFKEKAPGGFNPKSDKNDKRAVIFFKDYNQHKDGHIAEEDSEVHVCYTFYDENKAVIDSSYGEPEIIPLCYHDHNMGWGFEIGIEGMHCGCIRRIIIPRHLLSEHLSEKVEKHAVCDVELVKVKKWSGQCHPAARFFLKAGKRLFS